MNRAINFSAGPSMLPLPVLERVQAELFDFQGSGMSVMEVSHRGPIFASVQEQIESDLAELLSIPSDYRIVLMQGGGQAQFSMIPLNFGNGEVAPVYIETGHWGRLAVKAAHQYVSPHVIQQPHSVCQPSNGWGIDGQAAYLYTVDNETVDGLEFSKPPKVGQIPLISDMSSNFLSRPIAISDYGMVFACAQKNLGIAGVTVAIISEELLSRTAMSITPPLYTYAHCLSKDSLPNTPATFSWYVMGLVLQWIKQEGGLSVMNDRAIVRSQLLYDYIDQSSLYTAPVESESRSRMNVTFGVAEPQLESAFLQQAEQSGLTHLKGHKAVGGFRASLYNSMPLSGVQALIDFMKTFEKES